MFKTLRRNRTARFGLIVFVIWLVVAITCLCAYITTIVKAIQTENLVLGILGGFIPPVGIVNGILNWFGRGF